ncbi:MAG: sugar phosphate nucleotidyltransferase [Patescibacteria group bacterium]|nr:sugar phosphate nucleotidyltransferase [Patescibacteria group bacterium]
MKGVILAGGKGTRLWPITKVTNKHLVPVWRKPMIHYPLEQLAAAGVKDILIVTGPEHAGHFLHLLGSGKDFGARLSYEMQEEAGGIAQALSLAEDFADGGKIAVILGDNIFDHDMRRALSAYAAAPAGARLFLKAVADAERFGVAEIQGSRIVRIVEKPKHPKSNLAVTGLYFYDSQVFDIIRTLTPSARGELEITDVNNAYIAKSQLSYEIVRGFWSDAGTFDSLLRATMYLARKENAKRKDQKPKAQPKPQRKT